MLGKADSLREGCRKKRNGRSPSWANAISEVGWEFLIIPGWRSPPTSFQTTSDEKWRTGRWSPEGDGGVEEEELQFFSKRFISDFRSQCLVGCFSPVWEHPPTYDREQDFNFMQESESESLVKTVWSLLFSYRIIWFQSIWDKIVCMKVKVVWIRPYFLNL